MKYFQEGELLGPPVKRAAYSDRTAWVMAEMARLVYERLPKEKELNELLDELKDALSKGLKKDKLIGLVGDAVTAMKTPGESRTKDELERVNFTLFKTYSEGGTECMVVKIPGIRSRGGSLGAQSEQAEIGSSPKKKGADGFHQKGKARLFLNRRGLFHGQNSFDKPEAFLGS